MKSPFTSKLRVKVRTDNSNNPCGFDVVMTVPQTQTVPEHEEIFCFIPDGNGTEMRKRAEFIAALPEMLGCLDNHCEWCADCDFDSEPDTGCRFGALWKNLAEVSK